MERKINEVINRLNKTRQERSPNLRQERERRDQEERELQKQLLREKVNMWTSKKCGTPTNEYDVFWYQKFINRLMRSHRIHVLWVENYQFSVYISKSLVVTFVLHYT